MRDDRDVTDRQHVVSQFYLRHFSANGRQLHVYYLKRNKRIPGASLRDQCYRRDIYPDATEAALRDFEGDVAGLFRNVIASKALPPDGPSRSRLFLFLASQMVRTSAALREFETMTDVQLKRLVQQASGMTDDELTRTRPATSDSALILLSLAPKLAEHLSDLQLVLVEPEADREFITSDDPVIRYNTYTEQVRGASAARGVACIGLQVFVPLCPRLLLIGFDPAVYAASGHGLLKATSADVDVLNRLQAVYAMQNLYYLTPEKEDLLNLCRDARRHRAERRASLATYTEQGGDEGELLVYNSLTPNLGLRFSMLRVRKAADRVPLPDRFGRRIDARRGQATLAGKRFLLAKRETSSLADE